MKLNEIKQQLKQALDAIEALDHRSEDIQVQQDIAAGAVEDLLAMIEKREADIINEN